MRLRRIPPAAPYSLCRTIGAFARFPHELVDIVRGNEYRRVFACGDGLALLAARQSGSVDHDGRVDIELLAADNVGDDSVESTVDSMVRTLSLLEATGCISGTMQGNHRLAWLYLELAGLRRTLDPTPFEGLVSSILAQLISIRGAAVVRGRLVRRFGRSLEYGGNEYWAFPEPDTVRRSSVDELCGLGMTRTKARAILTVAELAESGELEFDDLNRESDSDLIRRLVSTPGIGPWTAEWFLVNVMGRMSIVPSGDLGIRRSTGKWLLNGGMPSAAEVRQVYEPYGDIRAYVAYFILSAERLSIDPPVHLFSE